MRKEWPESLVAVSLWGLILSCLWLPQIGRAQFLYTTNAGTITITGYSGPYTAVTIPTSTNEVMISSYRRNYEYNDQALRYLIDMAGLQKKAYKINPRAVDKFIENPEIDEDIRSGFKDARTLMTETRQIQFVKPPEPGTPKPAEEETEAPAEEAV